MKLEALRALEKAVEAGRDESEKWRPSFGEFGHKAMMAFHGSLNAAMALHDAVLPEWDYSIDNVQRTYVHVYLQHDEIPAVWAENPDPARAWLLAIIRALIAKAEAKGV